MWHLVRIYEVASNYKTVTKTKKKNHMLKKTKKDKKLKIKKKGSNIVWIIKGELAYLTFWLPYSFRVTSLNPCSSNSLAFNKSQSYSLILSKLNMWVHPEVIRSLKALIEKSAPQWNHYTSTMWEHPGKNYETQPFSRRKVVPQTRP